LVIMAGRN